MVNYQEYIQSEEWLLKADRAKRAAAHRCQICNRHEDEVILDAHHRTYDRLGKEMDEDITVLCRDCHDLYSREGQLAKYGLAELYRRRPTVSFSDKLDDVVKTGPPTQIRTGYKDLDALLGTLEAGSVYLVASTPSMGKTSFVAGTALTAALQDELPTVVFTLQHTTEQFTRLLASQRGVNYQRLTMQGLGKDAAAAVYKQRDLVGSRMLWLNDTPALTPEGLEIAFGEISEGIKHVIIDGVDMMRSSTLRLSLAQEQNDIARSLKTIATRLRVPIIATKQLEKHPLDRVDKRPQLTDLSGTGGWERFADVVIFIYRDELVNPSTTRQAIAEIHVARNNRGPTGVIDLFFDQHGMGFRNLDRLEIDL